jgi:predicted aminopeptidase
MLVTGVGLLSGCGCYYTHLALGQARLLLARRPVDRLLENTDTPAELRSQLDLVEETRRFATSLDLDVGGQYTSYVAWPGDRVITSVVATRERSIEPAGFRFPIIGEAPYKGFFDLERAEREAESLRRQGMDVCLLPVSAYSTLGWMDDPVTGPMLRSGDGKLVEVLLHELVHATVFVKSQPEFNEGVAHFVGQEASVRFFTARDAPEPSTDPEFRPPTETSGANPDEWSPSARRRARVRDDRLLAAALADIRERIRELYADDLVDEERQARRQALEVEARSKLAELSFETRHAGSLAERIALNDACLALAGTYTADAERYAEVLESLDGDLPTFVQRLKRAAASDDPRAAFFGESLTPAEER